jgi:hypothetical protein
MRKKNNEKDTWPDKLRGTMEDKDKCRTPGTV